MRVVCLTSGGVDSTVLLHMLSKSSVALPLFVDYGQEAVRPEKTAAEAACGPLGLRLAVVRVRGLLDGPAPGRRGGRGGPGRHDGSGQEVQGANPGEGGASPYVPKRNMLLLSAAASLARLNSCDAVAIGTIRGVAYGDQTEEFVQKAEAALSADGRIVVMAPLAGMDKVEVGRLARVNGVPLHLTYSCDVGRDEQCGSCAGCRDRRAALEGTA